jgi:cell division protein FtsN
MKLNIEEAFVNGSTYYRIQAGPFPTKATASDVCAQLKVENQGCILKNKKS